MDQTAIDYLTLALSLGELEAGIVDAYYGPAELRERAAKDDPATLAGRAVRLRSEVQSNVSGQRREWLERQLIAVETMCRRLAGEEIGYVAEVEACFDARPEMTPARNYELVHAQLDELLPGKGDLRRRLGVRDDRLSVPADRLPAVVDWLLEELRGACVDIFPLPAGESLTVTLVKNQPWGAYNWYEGSLRSRIEINTDLPVHAHQLIGLLSHEAYPGHHVEHAWKEARLVSKLGRAEASVQLINTPEAFVSEGLAEIGGTFVYPAARWQQLLVTICERAGISMTASDAEREWTIGQALRPLRGASGDAALMLHAERRSVGEVQQFMERRALRTPEQARKNIEFISHPLWRAYVFCYAGGERLLTEWCAAAGNRQAQRDRFFRLLTEQLTPSQIRRELSEGAG